LERKLIYSPKSEKCPLPFSPFKSCTVPRPIGWLSTRSKDGVDNLAPYSQWQNVSFDPPIVMFSANRNGDGSRKDTVINAENTGWFVWNMATFELREQVNISAMELAPEVDEFIQAGLTKADCASAPCSRVMDSPVHFECRYLKTVTFDGNSPQGTADVVFGEVEHIHIKDDVITNDGKLDILKIRPISRLGYYDYSSITEIFEMQIPNMDGSLASGLEGKASS
jgi:flavin reductase (DIM6/NTAB) family NADH-FMN oxidoreductase RutF